MFTYLQNVWDTTIVNMFPIADLEVVVVVDTTGWNNCK